MSTVEADAVTGIDEELDAALDGVAQGLAHAVRSPVLRTPAESGLVFEDVSFPSTDGTALEAWFIPCEGSEKLIVFEHPMMFNRYGFAAHVEPWRSAFGTGYGNDVEVSFIEDYRILHEAGYNVLTFDFRNFGLSGAANGGLMSGNRFEARDVLGALAYVSRPDLAAMTVGIVAGCMGGNATFRAIDTDPAAFDGVRCLVAPLLLSPMAFVERALENLGAPTAYAAEVERRTRLLTGCALSEASPVAWAPSVRMPTLTYGVREDALVGPDDLEAIHAAIGARDKSLFWIDGTRARWDGYLYFQRHPEEILAWLAGHMD
jgi:uncharacterized protein